jgi:hypothetical protein
VLSASPYFVAVPEGGRLPLGGWEKGEGAGAAGFLAAFGFFASRVLRF